MSLYRLRFRLEAPLLVGDRDTGNVYQLSRYGYIPSTTVKGGILSWIYIFYGVRDVRVESKSPSIYIKPAYPSEDGVASRPTTYLHYRCKMCHPPTNIYLDSNVVKALGHFKIDDYVRPGRCPDGHAGAIVRASGNVIPISRGPPHKYKLVALRTTQLESVSINRLTGGSETGMLYSYIAYSPGNEFSTILYDKDGRISRWIGKLPNRFTIFMGRGVSRGMGVVSVEAEELDKEKFIGDRAEIIKEGIEKLDGIVVLNTISIFVGGFKGYGLDLRGIGLEELIIYRHKKLNYIPSGEDLLKGYSRSTNLPKISVRGLSPGSLYFYRVRNRDRDEVARELAKVELVGFSEPYDGYTNYMEVMSLE